MTAGESAGRAFAVDAEGLCLSFDGVGLDLGDVMGDIVNLFQTQFAGTFTQHLDKGLPYPVGNTLAVSPGVIGGAGHRGQIILAFRRLYRRTNQLAVGNVDAITVSCLAESPDIVITDLGGPDLGAGMN